MKIKTFRARTMTDALRLVKKEFGASAVILNTRTTGGSKLLGWGGREIVEITAARDSSEVPSLMRPSPPRAKAAGSVLPRAQRNPPEQRAQRGMGAAYGARAVAEIIPNRPTTPAEPVSTTHNIQVDDLRSDMRQLKSLVAQLVRQSRGAGERDIPEQLTATYQSLIENRVAQRLARVIVDRVTEALSAAELEDADIVRRCLSREIENMVPAAGAISLEQNQGVRVIALVGPTGVGKTTTIAKLAAQFRLREGKRVGLVTVDTYRIGAIRQLGTYAEIIDIPLKVAATPEEYSDALDQLSNCEVVLVDTAGRSQRDSVKLEQLQGFFAARKPNEIHLVLSSAGDEATLLETIERFGVLQINRVIFTKIDEAVGFGVMLACLEKAGAALSYITTGQDVPDDIRVGCSSKLARMVMEESPERLECTA